MVWEHCGSGTLRFCDSWLEKGQIDVKNHAIETHETTGAKVQSSKTERRLESADRNAFYKQITQPCSDQNTRWSFFLIDFPKLAQTAWVGLGWRQKDLWPHKEHDLQVWPHSGRFDLSFLTSISIYYSWSRKHTTLPKLPENEIFGTKFVRAFSEFFKTYIVRFIFNLQSGSQWLFILKNAMYF